MFFYFSVFISHCQKERTIYFLIDSNDTLIKTQRATKSNSYSGYVLIDTSRTVIRYRRAMTIDGDDKKYKDYDSYSFRYTDEHSRNFTETKNISEIQKLNFIDSRTDLISKLRSINENLYNFIFIQQLDSDHFILRKVYPNTHM